MASVLGLGLAWVSESAWVSETARRPVVTYEAELFDCFGSGVPHYLSRPKQYTRLPLEPLPSHKRVG